MGRQRTLDDLKNDLDDPGYAGVPPQEINKTILRYWTRIRTH